jgi:protein ImuA
MPHSLQNTVELLHRKLALCAAQSAGESLSTGIMALDNLLPERGVRSGSLVEYLGNGSSLALAAARVACRERPFIVLDRERRFHPAAWGQLTNTVFVQPATEAEELWALDQCLRCPGVGMVLFHCERLKPRDFRRLQLAAEAGGTVGMLVRPVSFRGRPTWAEVQWLTQPFPSHGRRRLRVALLRCRGGPRGASVILELDDNHTWQAADHAGALSSLAPLADSTFAGRRSRA